MNVRENNAYKIVNNMPLPPIQRGSVKYPFHELEVNQTILVPAHPQIPAKKQLHNIRVIVNYYQTKKAKKEGITVKFAVRLLADNSIGIWRIM